MKLVRIAASLAVVVAGLTASRVEAQAPKGRSSKTRAADRAAVERAALDYVEGFYEGDSVKLARSVRPEVVKFGFYIAKGDSAYAGEAMAYGEFFTFARRVRENHRQRGPDVPRAVRILDLLDQTAAVKVTAYWGTDFLHLARYDGRWMIVHVLWQTPPPAAR